MHGDDCHSARCIECGRFVPRLWDASSVSYYGELDDNTLCEEHGGPAPGSPVGDIFFAEQWFLWFAGKNVAIGPHAPVERPYVPDRFTWGDELDRWSAA